MSASAVLKLQKVGFTVEQVEALADLVDTQAASTADLMEAKAALRTDLMEVEHHLDSKISAVKSDVILLKWMVGFVLAFQIALFVKLFVH